MGSSLNQSTEDASNQRGLSQLWQKHQWQSNLLLWCLNTIAASRALIGLCILICLVLSLRQIQGPPVYQVELLLIQNSDPASSLRSAGSGISLSSVLGGGGPASMPKWMSSKSCSNHRKSPPFWTRNTISCMTFSGATGTPKIIDGVRRTGRLVFTTASSPPWAAYPKEGFDDYDLANFLGSNMNFSKQVFGVCGWNCNEHRQAR